MSQESEHSQESEYDFNNIIGIYSKADDILWLQSRRKNIQKHVHSYLQRQSWSLFTSMIAYYVLLKWREGNILHTWKLYTINSSGIVCRWLNFGQNFYYYPKAPTKYNVSRKIILMA